MQREVRIDGKNGTGTSRMFKCSVYGVYLVGGFNCVAAEAMADVEETLKRIQSQKNVAGVIVMDSSGRAIRSTLDDEATQQHCILLHQLCDKSKSVIRELDGSNDLTFLRLRTRKHEIMIAPDKDFLLAVIQNITAQF